MKSEQLVDQILVSEAFKTRLLAFFEAWLGYGPNVDLSTLPALMTAGLMPNAIPTEAYDELRAFVTATVFTTSGGITDLLLSNDVYAPGPNLAKIYKLELAGPTPGTPLKLDALKYGGLLSRVAMNLAVDPISDPIACCVKTFTRRPTSICQLAVR